jgi:uncharacterized protein (TIRG00374 family)
VRSALRKFAPLAIKVLLAAIVFGYLGWKASQDHSFDALRSNDKNWGLLACAWVMLATMVALQAMRWRLLANALGLAVGFWEALRIGFIAHFGSQFMLGMVIGDAIRAGSVSRNNRGRVTEAIACTLFDRMIGLYGLFVVASIASFFFDAASLKGKVDDGALQTLVLFSWIARLGSVAGTVGITALFIPGLFDMRVWRMATAWPVVGKTIAELLNAGRLYRTRPGAIATALATTLALHFAGALSIHFVAEGLPSEVTRPGLVADLNVYILTSPLNALPMGPFDFTFDALYRGVSSPDMPKSHGFVIVLAWRLVGAAVALIGFTLFLYGPKRADEIATKAELNG